MFCKKRRKLQAEFDTLVERGDYWMGECQRARGELAEIKDENEALKKNLRELADLTKYFIEML